MTDNEIYANPSFYYNEKKTPKLFKLLSTLEYKELKKLRDFLSSPYFNKTSLFVRLFDRLKLYHPNYEHVDTLQIFEEICPKEAISLQNINERFSQLSRLVETFLRQETLQNQTNTTLQLSLDTFHDRNLPDEFVKLVKKNIEILKSAHPLNDTQSQLLWSIHHRIHRYVVAGRLLYRKDAPDPIKYLDEYYLLQKLRHSANTITETHDSSEHYNILLLEEILQSIPIRYPHHPILSFYHKLCSHMMDDASFSYEQVQKAFFQCSDRMEEDEQHFVLLVLINLVNKQLRKGRGEYSATILKLYQRGVKKGLFLKPGRLTVNSFLNICSIAAANSAFDWIHDFIETHEPLLVDKNAKNAGYLARAMLAFNKAQFVEAQGFLDEIHTNEIVFKIRSRNLYVRCLLEFFFQSPSTYSTLRSYCNAQEKFINRTSKLNQNRKSAYLNLNKTIKRIAELWLDGWNDPVKKKALEEYIDGLNPIMSKNWLKKTLQKQQ